MLPTNDSLFRKILLPACIAMLLMALMTVAAGSVFPVYPFPTVTADGIFSRIFNNSQQAGAPA